jgi:PAS domain S-box-containing protein
MNKSILRTSLFYAVLAGGFFLLDLAIDRLIGGSASFNLPHIIFAVLAVLTSFILLSNAMEKRRLAEAVLRQARDELESRVRQRTAELERANAALQTEIAERKLAEEERQRMEQALRESEERYRTQFDNFSEPTTVWDRNGVLLMQNLISAKNLGGRREDYLGKSIYALFGEAAKGYHERMVRVIDTGISENQEDVVDLDFGKRNFSTSMQRIQNPDGQYAVQIISYDITDRKQVEETIRASEEKFATVFQVSPDAIGIVRVADGTILDVNEAFTKMLGYSRSDAIGWVWTELGLVSSIDERDKLIELYRREEKVVDYELAFMVGDGNLTTVLLSLTSITVSEEPCVLAIAHDITKRKRAEAALRQAQAELALGIRERTAIEERQRLSRELHDSVSQALYGISLGAHTALTLFDTDQPKVLEALNYILSQTQAGLNEMRALIFELRPESLATEGLLTALTKQTEALRARHEIDVELDLCDEPDVPLSIKEALYRIAQEAMQNAVKHARPSRLEVRLTCEPDSLQLEVRDNGIGFDPRAEYPGHLGLRSMRERAMSIGGALEINSAPESGTQIQAHIPIVAASKHH